MRDQRADKHVAARELVAKIGEHANEWAGVPYPLEGVQLVIEPKYRAATFLNNLHKPDHEDDEGITVINQWFDIAKKGEVFIWQEADGSRHHTILPAIHHIAQDLDTINCTQAWSLAAEMTAMDTLRGLITEHLFKMYFMAGMFLETSKKSNLTYIFRRLRPTVACSARANQVFHKSRDTSMRILACLCLHPIGYYKGTWAGAMCPTDDVIAHLLMMRADEPLFWKRTNHIPPWSPAAGL